MNLLIKNIRPRLNLDSLVLKSLNVQSIMVPHFFMDFGLIRLESIQPPYRFTPNDSVVKASIPISEPKVIQKFRFKGTARLGRILQIMDTLAGIVSYRHAQWPENALFATAAIQNFVLLEDIILNDIAIESSISYVGRTSLQVSTHLIQDNKLKAAAQFIMVCRDKTNYKSLQVPKLILPENHKDIGIFKQRYSQGHQALQKRKVVKDQLPDQMTLLQIHKTMVNPNMAALPIESTKVSSRILIHQDSKNIHGKAFGGIIIRLAIQNFYSAARQFSHSNDIKILFLDNIYFLKPIEVGSVVDIISKIVFTLDGLMVLKTVVKVKCVEGAQDQICTQLFACMKHNKTDKKQVRPISYMQGLQWGMGKKILNQLVG